MTRNLILIRHAEADACGPGMDDHARPLSPRGRRAAEALGRWLRDAGHSPGTILCSSARRTRETARLMELDAEVIPRDDLYLAEPDAMLTALQDVSGSTVALIGHNPGIAMLARSLVADPPPNGRFADFPPASTLVVTFDGEDWGAIAADPPGQVRDFITPRELSDR